MVYYSRKTYKLIGYEKSKRKDKMYNAILLNRKTKNKVIVPFGHPDYQNYRDLTGLNSYPKLIHNDPERRKRFRARHKGYLKKGHFSPSYFSYYILW